MRKILLTGSSGFLGSRLKIYLQKHHYDVTTCDIRDPNEPKSYENLVISSFDFIIHLAAHSTVALCEQDPEGAWQNNVANFKNLLENLKSDQTIIYASSASVYGSNPGVSIESSALRMPIKQYDLTKILGDLIAENSISKQKNVIGLRFGTLSGSSPNSNTKVVTAAMSDSAIKTGVINCINPKVRRGLLFLEDLERAILLIIKNPIKGIYNLNSINSNIGAIAEEIASPLNAKIIIMEDLAQTFYDFHMSSSKFISTYGEFQGQKFEQNIAEVLNYRKGAFSVG
jgi:nucleoside-diphosphate-sugar epimerase